MEKKVLHSIAEQGKDSADSIAIAAATLTPSYHKITNIIVIIAAAVCNV